MSSGYKVTERGSGQRKRSVWRKLLKDPLTLIAILCVAAYFVAFAVYPLLKVLAIAIFGQDGIDLSILTDTVTARGFLQTFLNSMKLGLLSAFFGTVIGFVFAYAVTRVGVRGRRFFHLIAIMPIISPPFILALSMILLFGRNGLITREVFGLYDTNVYGLSSLVIVQTLAFFPLAYLNIKGILESMDSSVEDAALNLGASRWRVFRTVTLPLAVPAILSSLLIVFIRSLEDFGNPIVIAGEYKVLSVQAYLQITGVYDIRGGAIMAFALILPALTAFIVQKYWVERRSFVTVTGKPSQSVRRSTQKRLVYPFQIFCVIASGAVLLFYGAVVAASFVQLWGFDYSLTWKHFAYVINSGLDTVVNSLTLAIISTPITGLLGMLIAYLLVRKRFRGRRALEVATILTFSVPGIVVGIGYILSFNQKPLLLTGTAAILIIAFVTRNVPMGIEAGSNSLRQVDVSVEEASANLGASGFRTFTKISLPLMRSALMSGLIYAFVKSMTSISAVIFLVSVGWNLMTVSILSQVQQSRLGAAAAYCTILIIIVLLALAIMHIIVQSLDYNSRWRRRASKTVA